MRKIPFSRDWLFKRESDTTYETIHLPHDYSVTMQRRADAQGKAQNGFFPTDSGIYIKYWKPEVAAEHYILDIDGAYMCAEVLCNEMHLGMHPHGYTPFLVDLSEQIRPGKTNKLMILTGGQQPSTRWYSGSGLYRDVSVWLGGPIRLEPWDTFVKTQQCSSLEATVSASYEVSSDLKAEVRLEAKILDAEGNVVAEAAGDVRLEEKQKTPAELNFHVTEPVLWEPEQPYLYTLYTEILYDGQVADTEELTFGIRSISADAEHGLLLNGKPIKLRGGCIHHDHGVLGAADYPAAVYRKLSLLKQAGFNAIRSSHNPPSLELLKVCDRMGILVMDEVFDMWNKAKTEQDYHLWFKCWWDKDIASMVRRERNHPCVISYSVGNEIMESYGTSDGAYWARILADEIRKYDTTRLVTTAVQQHNVRFEETDPEDYREEILSQFAKTDKALLAEWEGAQIKEDWAARTEAFFEPMDIAGYNYIYQRYELDHKLYPERVMWGSETHVLNFYDSWQQVKKHPYVLGDFTWTAYDNLGESGTGRYCWARDGHIPGISLAGYPWRTCYQGDLDLCGYRRPQSYFREAVWLGNTEPRIFTTHPEHYGEEFSGTGWHWYDVLDTWTFDDSYLGKPVMCEVYTDAEEVEWFLNGRSLGRSIPEKAIARFDIPYEKGEISVVAYRDQKPCGSSSIKTVGAAAEVTVVPETESLMADDRDLCYFRLTIVDAEGYRVPDARNELQCQVEGGTLLGIFSGDPANEDSFGSDRCHAFEGRALAVVRTAQPGNLRITVESSGLTGGTAQVVSREV